MIDKKIFFENLNFIKKNYKKNYKILGWKKAEEIKIKEIKKYIKNNYKLLKQYENFTDK